MTEVQAGEVLWTPSAEFAESSNLARYQDWLRETGRGDFTDYAALWQWSVAEPEAFWGSIWDYFQVASSTPHTSVLDGREMPGSAWFTGSGVNYAEHLLRHADAKGEATVIHAASELRPLSSMSWRELARQVRVVATRLRELGVRPGDRVAAYLPATPEAAVAMIATIAIGAVWSSAAPEFGVPTVTARFEQIEPTVLLVADGYRFGGKDFSRREQAGQITEALPSLRHVVWLPYLDPASRPPADLADALVWDDLLNPGDVSDFAFERVPHDHPIWILFSSGTTGLPKAIVHSHVGVLVEHLKVMHFHLDLGPSSTLFFYTTTGWMMWNLVLSALLTGAAVVLYDGSPMHPKPDMLWELAARTGVTYFGASPTFVQLMQKAGIMPGSTHDLSALRGMMVAGSPATPETFAWCYREVKSDMWVSSQSGGTDLCSGFVGAVPTLPVRAGEIQARMLGMDVHAFSDEGDELIGEVGELVVTTPFPSMPLGFFNDPDGRRYRESYFEVFPGVWRHGDFIRITPEGGCYIEGRSDSTLNRYGVRIGTAEIYRIVEQEPEVADSLVVCSALPDGEFFMPLFVRLAPGERLTEDLQARLRERLRREASPRHVPDEIVDVPAIPYTLTGKKMEVPVRKVLQGTPVEQAASRDAMVDPDALDHFVGLARAPAP